MPITGMRPQPAQTAMTTAAEPGRKAAVLTASGLRPIDRSSGIRVVTSARGCDVYMALPWRRRPLDRKPGSSKRQHRILNRPR